MASDILVYTERMYVEGSIAHEHMPNFYDYRFVQANRLRRTEYTLKTK